MGTSSLIFAASILIFLAVIVISIARVRTMSGLEFKDESSSGVAQASSYTVDGEQ